MFVNLDIVWSGRGGQFAVSKRLEKCIVIMLHLSINLISYGCERKVFNNGFQAFLSSMVGMHNLI